MTSVTEPIVVTVEGGDDTVQTYAVSSSDIGESGTVTLVEGQPTVTVASVDGKAVGTFSMGATGGYVTQPTGVSADTMLTIGGLLTALGLLLTIIAATLIHKMLKNQNAAGGIKSGPVSFSPMAQQQAGGDAQLVAVITAALMAYQGQQGGGNGQLVVRSVRRVGSSSGWASAGRNAQIN